MGRIKTLDEIKAEVRTMTGKSKIFRRAKPADVESVLAKLTSKDPDLWAAEWSRVAQPYEEAGKAHEQAGRINQAREAYIQAYTYYAAGRYPVPHCSGNCSPSVKAWSSMKMPDATSIRRFKELKFRIMKK